ncbi:MAG: WD40 repeat domain-containing protein [Raineya sp.]|nr:WD40 repeat domain-containing protein [Raineya sp.]
MKKLKVQKIDTLTGHRDCVYSLEKGIDENHFFSSGGDGLVVIWNLKKPEIGKLVAQVPRSVYALHSLPQYNALIIGQNMEGLHWIDLTQMREKKTLKTTQNAIFDLKHFQDLLFTANADGSVQIIDIESWRIQHTFLNSMLSARCLALQFQMKHLAVGYSDYRIRIFDIEARKLLYEWQAHKNSVFSLFYSPCGKYLISGSRDAHLKVWSVENAYELLIDIPAHLFAINHIVGSPCGRYFATGSMDKTIKIWDSQTFRLLKVLDKARYAGHSTSINKLLWHQPTQWLLSGSDDRTIGIWQIEEENYTQ